MRLAETPLQEMMFGWELHVQDETAMTDRPNILIFMTDQQRGDSVLAGNAANMPVIDRFRDESVTFTQAFCPSPHCCPSRATFMSGLYPTEHGVWNNVNVRNALTRGLKDGVRLWSEDLRDAGYLMDFSGKWHVSNDERPADRGWREHHATGLGSPAGYASEQWGAYEKLSLEPDPMTRKRAEILRPGWGTYTHYGVSEAPHGDEAVVQAALDVIRNRSGDGPWCQYVGTLGPHDPYWVPQRFLDMYDPKDIELPSTFEDRMEDKPALYRRTRGRFDQLTEAEHREAIHHYLAFCSYEDWLFGQILEALEESGDVENTVVMYLSDHGDYCAEHGLWCKGLPCFRSAYHVPAIIRWPAGVENPGRTVDSFVSLADFAPTILEMAGVAPDREFRGSSLMSFVKDEEPVDWRDEIFTQSNGNELYGIQRSVMTKEWKFVYNGYDFDELYNLKSDPETCVNLINDPAYEGVLKDMWQRIWRFARETDDEATNSYIMVALAPYGPGYAFRG